MSNDILALLAACSLVLGLSTLLRLVLSAWHNH